MIALRPVSESIGVEKVSAIPSSERSESLGGFSVLLHTNESHQAIRLILHHRIEFDSSKNH